MDMSKSAIAKRWENGYQVRDAGGWVKVAGQPDPRLDVRALLDRIEQLEADLDTPVIEATPAPPPKLSTSTERTPLAVPAVDTRGVDEDEEG